MPVRYSKLILILGDLGAIDKQYDVAVSTACGALDNIVVEDTAAAQKCLELLRKGSLGVATCLMLDKQAHLARSACEKVSTPEGKAMRQSCIYYSDLSNENVLFI